MLRRTIWSGSTGLQGLIPCSFRSRERYICGLAEGGASGDGNRETLEIGASRSLAMLAADRATRGSGERSPVWWTVLQPCRSHVPLLINPQIP